MNAISIETRIIRPEVMDACYAFDGAYWRVERHRDGSSHRHLLDRPPAGAQCYASNDDFATWWTFTVPAQSWPLGEGLFILIALLAFPFAFLLLLGSSLQIILAAGTAVCALAALQARFEHRRHRDPATIGRLAAASAIYLVATHHRHAHRYH